jgi:hypothetical protein
VCACVCVCVCVCVPTACCTSQWPICEHEYVDIVNIFSASYRVYFLPKIALLCQYTPNIDYWIGPPPPHFTPSLFEVLKSEAFESLGEYLLRIHFVLEVKTLHYWAAFIVLYCIVLYGPFSSSRCCVR